MNLKDLLRGRSREQVPFDLPTPAIAPTKNFSAGNYRVAVQQAPDASQTTAGRLANALSQVSPALHAYGKAQQAVTELQNKTVALDYAQMDEEEKRLFAERLRTEESISRKYKGENYSLNPVNIMYAKELIGADLAPEFMMLWEQRKADYISEIVEKRGDRPSPQDIQGLMDTTMAEFQSNNAEILGADADPFMIAGFRKKTNEMRDEMSVKMFNEASEAHKTRVLIPKAASALVQSLQADTALTDEETLERIASVWTRTIPLNADEQRAVIEMALSSAKPEEAEEYLNKMMQAGLKIGNEPLVSGDRVWDAPYWQMHEAIQDRKHKERNDIVERENSQSKLDARDYRAQIDTIYRADGSFDDKEEQVEAIEKQIGEIDNEYERNAKLSAFRAAQAEFNRYQATKLSKITEFARDARLDNPNSFLQVAFEESKDVIDENIAKYKLKELKQDDPLRVFFENIADINFKEYDLTNLQAGESTGFPSRTILLFQSFESKMRDAYKDLSEELSVKEEGDQIEFDGQTIVVAKDKAVQFKNLMAKKQVALAEEAGVAFQELIDKNVDVLDQNKLRQAEYQEAVNKLGEREARKQANLNDLDINLVREKTLPSLSATGVTATEGRERWVPSGRLFESDFLGFDDAEYWRGRISETSFNLYLGFKAARQAGKFAEGFSNGLADGSYEPRKAAALFDYTREKFGQGNWSEVFAKELMWAKTETTPGINQEHPADVVSRQGLAIKNIIGYSVEDIRQGILSNKSKEGIEFPGNGLQYFKANMLGGSTPEGRAISIINYDENNYQEELKNIANIFGVTPEVLHEAQTKARAYYRGELMPKSLEAPEKPELQAAPKFELKPDITPESTPASQAPTEQTPVAPPPPTVPGISSEDITPLSQRTSLDITPQDQSEVAQPGEEQLEFPQLKVPAKAGEVGDSSMNLVKRFEGFEPEAKWDYKQYSVGYGSVGKKGEKITREEAEKRLKSELTVAALAVDSYNEKYNWTPNERDALISFAYNVGTGKEGLQNLLKNGTRSKEDIAKFIIQYYNVTTTDKKTGKKIKSPSKGLLIRRKAERDLFIKKD